MKRSIMVTLTDDLDKVWYFQIYMDPIAHMIAINIAKNVIISPQDSQYAKIYLLKNPIFVRPFMQTRTKARSLLEDFVLVPDCSASIPELAPPYLIEDGHNASRQAGDSRAIDQ